MFIDDIVVVVVAVVVVVVVDAAAAAAAAAADLDANERPALRASTWPNYPAGCEDQPVREITSRPGEREALAPHLSAAPDRRRRRS